MHGHDHGPGDEAAGVRRRWGPGWEVWAAAAAVSGFFAWLVLDLWHVMAVDNLGALAAPLVAAGACRRRAREEAGRLRNGWLLLAASALSWALGQAVWTYHELIAGHEVPFPSAADVGYLLAVPLSVAALLSFFVPPVGWTSRLRLVADGCIVASATLFISWFTVLGPLVEEGSGGWVAEAIGIAYPAGDVLIISMIVLVGARSRSDDRSTLAWISAGLLCIAAADTAFAYFTLRSLYATGNLLDAGWVAGYLALAVAARRRPAARRGRSRELIGLPYVPVVAALVLCGARFVSGRSVGGFLLADICLVVAFLVARQVLTLLENRSLTAGLEATVHARTLELHHSEGRLRSLVANVSDVISVIDGDGTVRYASPSVRAVFGYEAAEIVERSVLDLVHPDDVAAVTSVLSGAGRTSRRLEIRVRHADGAYRHVEAVGADMREDPALGGFVFTTRDVTERRELEAQLSEQAFHDPLTGLANRLLLCDRIGHSLERIRRTGRDLSVAFVDLDDFKSVNDALGHAAGDRLLVELAARLTTAVRPGDTVARLGGDEFAVLMEETDEEAGLVVAERIAAAIASPVSIDGTEVMVTASIGVATSTERTRSPDDVLGDADLAMYRAKTDGKARQQIFRPEMHQAVVDRAALLAELRRALDRGEFELHYQPLVELGTGRLSSLEALVRWVHPTRGVVGPGEFIPIAEDSGLIVPLGAWVLETAAGQLAAWSDLAIDGPPLTMSVNVSVRQFHHPGFVEHVAGVLARTGLAPGRLTLEVTESILLGDAEATVARILDLKELGVRFAVDDFGTGFSSLAYLRRFPVDCLKIDKSFVDDIASAQGAELVRTFVELGNVLGLDTVAEGIEQPAQSAALRADGCHLGQGYLFSPPLCREAAENLLVRQRTGDPAGGGAAAPPLHQRAAVGSGPAAPAAGRART